jgi:hypothetical protein
MARLPRYSPLNIEIAPAPRVNYVSAGSAQASAAQRLSSSLDQMSRFVFQRAGEVATAAGVAAGAKEPAEVLRDLMSRDPGTMGKYEQAAYESASRVYGAELETQARLEMGRISSTAKVNQTPSGELSQQLQSVIDGYGDGMAMLSPTASAELRNRLSLIRDSLYLKQSEVEIEAEQERRKAEAIKAQDLTFQAFETFGASGLSTQALDKEIEAERQHLVAQGFGPVEVEKLLNTYQAAFHRSRLSSQYSRIGDLQGRRQFVADLRSQINEGSGDLIDGLNRSVQETLLKSFESDVNSGLAVLSTTRTKIKADITRLLSDVVSQGTVASQSAVSTIYNDLEKFVADGGDASSLIPLIREFDLLQGDVLSLSRMSLPELRSEVNERYSGLGDGADPVERERYDIALKILNDATSRISSDPVQHAINTGRVSPDLANVEDMGRRVSSVAAFATQNNISIEGLEYLTKEEEVTVANALSEGTVAERLALMRDISRGFGSGAVNVFAQVSPKNPIAAHVAGLLNSGASPSDMETALRGHDLISEGAALRASNERADKTSVLLERMGNLPRTPTVAAGIIATADALYVGMGGSTGEGDFDEDKYKDALERAAGKIQKNGVFYGGIDEYNGKTIVIPNNVEAGGLSDLIRTALESDISLAGNGPPLALNGEPVGLNRLKSGLVLTSVSDGVVAVQLSVGGSVQDLLDQDGMAYRLDIRKLQDLVNSRIPSDDPELLSLRRQYEEMQREQKQRRKDERRNQVGGLLGGTRAVINFGIVQTAEQDRIEQEARARKAKKEDERTREATSSASTVADEIIAAGRKATGRED